MTFLAEQYSGFFRRSVAALQSRPEADVLEPLHRLIEAPLTRERVAQLVQEGIAQATGLAHGAVDSSVLGNLIGRALRRARQLLILALMERDIQGAASLQEVCTAMSAFAAAVTQAALAQAGREIAEQYGTPNDALGQPQDLLAVAMGKGGADELNVSSDLDLVFVYRDEGECAPVAPDAARPVGRAPMAASEFMHRVARRTLALLSDNTADGFVFRVDTRLRPNGDSGPLVASLAMLEEYFYAQGREWERFAWLKGVVIADSGLAGAPARLRDEQSLASIVTPFVFRRYLDFRAFGSLRDLHALIRTEVTRRDARDAGSIDVKLGRGGIREIEFVAQLFQVVRGGRDTGLRDRRTLATLAGLAERGVLPADDAQALAKAYELLRRTEHALQYREDAQTHRLPSDPAERAQIAGMLGLPTELFETELELARNSVQRVFDGLLHNGSEASVSPGADGAADETPVPASITNRIEQLRAGARYRSAREETRNALERLLSRAQADRCEEAAFGRLIDLIETVIGRPAYLALLSQYPQAQARVMRLLGLSRWAAEYLTRHPIVLDELLDGQVLEPVDYAAWERTVRGALAQAQIDGQPDVERQMDIVREAHHAQVFRLLVQDLEGLHTTERLADLLSDLADRVLAIGIDSVWPTVRHRHRDSPRFAAIAYGKLGGKELGYASDLDLVFVYDDDDERAPEAYAMLSQRLANWLSTRTSAGQLFEIDLRLRPNGNAGLLVSSLDGFRKYQRESAWVWEHQALTRARFAAGDSAIGEAFEAERRALLSRERDPVALRDEVVKMRAKMHDGHPNRSQLFDLKHDEGGMVDIEFIVQYLVLAHAPRHPELLDNAGNIALLGRAGRAGLIDDQLAGQVASAYRQLRQAQHQLRLNDASYARVDPTRFTEERQAVRALWQLVLG
ncbi:MAG: bifunctional [glutamate--ammonia ligase]-adenylyl-L-tyrosine phosphorylase/[glutamate--ammonia-ligase] adenylyltransferase [Burkholderiaceae bacterium]|nr:bifunctional [glutamate--ammonia ligase]-adenylyl-L-tyrosine phosphorylase/[glutamate--ammonia-ligase] adenylyltransferase [Burkholderiaceae bacterium]